MHKLSTFKGKYINIKLKDIPSYEFEIGHPAIHWTFTDSYKTSVYMGDKIEIDILREEFETKISKATPTTFSDQFNYRFIEVYGLRKGKQHFLTLESYNKALNSNAKHTWWIWGLIAMGIWVFVFFEIGSLRKLKRIIT